MDLKLDKDLLMAALKQVVHQRDDVERHDVAVMADNPMFRMYILERIRLLAEANNGEILFARVATIFHLGMETGYAYRELQRPQ